MDNIKFVITNYDFLKKDYLVNLLETKSGTQFGFLYKKTEFNKNRDWSLKIFVRKDNAIVICGSIRKWYFGKYTLKNLTLADYKECMAIIAEKLGLRKKEIMLCSVKKMELSLSLRLDPKNRFMLLSFVEYATPQNSDSKLR